MTRARPWLFGACLGTALSMTLVSAPAPAAPAGPAPSDCHQSAAPETVEEQRLSLAAPQEILARSGFDRLVAAFDRELCGATGLDDAERVVTAHGRALWDAAVDRAQGRGPDGGDLAREDDRPLYWARLGMTKALRSWTPGFALSQADREALLERLERTSRGQDSIDLPPGAGIRRILVTGFDPFSLDSNIRNGNPSGANALALDGITVETPSGPARIETAMFPVRWADFTDGMFEHTVLPHLTGSSSKADAVITVSQGYLGFNIERWNGAWRGGGADNLRVNLAGHMIPIPEGVPTVTPQPQFVPTTLPYAAIVAADTGRFPVKDNTSVNEIPEGETKQVHQPDGPTPGSTARSGGGGSYLSNEIAYRATLLRDAVGADIPAGHVHTPILLFHPDNRIFITDPTFEQNRRDIIEQARRIVLVVANHIR